jgi:hypothetical protein
LIVIVAVWFPVNFFQWSTRNGLVSRVWLGLLGNFSRDFGWKSIFETSKVDFRNRQRPGFVLYIYSGGKNRKKSIFTNENKIWLVISDY